MPDATYVEPQLPRDDDVGEEDSDAPLVMEVDDDEIDNLDTLE